MADSSATKHIAEKGVMSVSPRPVGGGRLSPELVASLDLARAAAAFYVVIHHVTESRGWAHGLGIIFRFGQEAVIVFFLLSGFVIFANEAYRPGDTAGYYMRRFLRIYPPFLLALLLATLIAVADGTFSQTFNWWEFAGNLLNLQDISLLKPGVIVDPYMANGPLWSLSYEVVFYLAFPLVLSFQRRNPGTANHVVGLMSCAAYVLYVILPNHFFLVIAYFLMWWVGGMAAEAYLRGETSILAIKVPLLWLIALTLVTAGVVPVLGFKRVGTYPFLMFRHFACAVLFLISAYGPIGRFVARRAAAFREAAAFTASISYGIYVFHRPLLVQWHFAWTLQGFCIAVVLLLMLSYLVDRRLGKMLRQWQRRRAEIGAEVSETRA